jgi:glycine betaine/proline transport system ATP-binding protein
VGCNSASGWPGRLPLIRRQLQDQFLALSQRLGKTTRFITHDLDEAIRVGSRIAIMKDGRIVQTGTPEDIVTKPADEYVRAFVQNISKLGLITARTIMDPLASVQATILGGIRNGIRILVEGFEVVLVGTT